LKEANGARNKIIATDGVFSMDGYIAKLGEICDLAEKYDSLVMIDDCHAVGFMGTRGRGTHEYCDVMGRIDIITGTLGKALGGALGGYTSGKKEIIEMLRQRSRPYLFSNSVAPPIVGASIAAIDMLRDSTTLRDKLMENTKFFREEIAKTGLEVLPGEHPIVPVMFGDATPAVKMAELLLQKGIYVIPFSFPVVPKGKARIRTQVSAAHSREDLQFAVEKFAEAKEELGI
jgi:glycine C-acetyltransferase